MKRREREEGEVYGHGFHVQWAGRKAKNKKILSVRDVYNWGEVGGERNRES